MWYFYRLYASGSFECIIYYCKKFYLLYTDNDETAFFQQLDGKIDANEPFQQLGGIFEIPWGHHCLIMDKVKGDKRKAVFYVSQTIENGWSRAIGFAYVGKEYRLKIGETENFIDLLFYNLNLSCYVVIEVKIGKFAFSDAGQLGGYVVACNHLLRKDGRDNPTIGLLICKEKDRVQAQYALEASTQPIAISEYDLEKFYPAKVEGTIPTIAEIEASLNEEKEQE